jgi:hypothetical protein
MSYTRKISPNHFGEHWVDEKGKVICHSFINPGGVFHSDFYDPHLTVPVDLGERVENFYIEGEKVSREQYLEKTKGLK